MKTNAQLLPRLSRRDAYLLIVGNIIGIGIFTTSGYIANYVPSSGWMLLLWLLGGFLTFCGGLTYAELASRFPQVGGDYHYLTHAFHPALGFLFGWSTFVVTYTGSIATIAVGFAYYFANLLPEGIRTAAWQLPLVGIEMSVLKVSAVSITLLLTLINVRGVKSAARVQNGLTLLGILVLLGFVFSSLISPAGSWGNLKPLWPAAFSFSHLQALGVAFVGIYFTYSGWTAVVYIAGEIRDPRKNIPAAMWQGILTVMLLYLAMNLVYFLAFRLGKMANVVDIGFRTLQHVQGDKWSYFFNIMIMLAVLSTLNATILSGARIYYAMGRERRFFRFTGELSPRNRTPAKALWLQFAWTALLIFSGSFNQLLTYTVFVMVLFAFLAGLALFVFRFREKKHPAGFQIPLYPLPPLIYVLVTAWILLNTLRQHPGESLAGVALVLSGLPFYWYWTRKTTASAL